jgi:hypothetical protein
MLCSFASLDESSLSEIRSYEKKSGRIVLAYACKDIGIDSMSEEELAELKSLEDRLRLQLVAVK